jgi:hypothetical protein
MDPKDDARNNRLSLQSKKRVSDVLYHDARKACNDTVKVSGCVPHARSRVSVTPICLPRAEMAERTTPSSALPRSTISVIAPLVVRSLLTQRTRVLLFVARSMCFCSRLDWIGLFAGIRRMRPVDGRAGGVQMPGPQPRHERLHQSAHDPERAGVAHSKGMSLSAGVEVVQ